ncbi:MAG TPA: hypothetical protein VMZ91_15000 [Candidatus Paceibacterota bacterium]|nr:hypothetical protein [Candidatus Paceibacterota bacterium]
MGILAQKNPRHFGSFGFKLKLPAHMILENLIEKKDLVLYLKFRIEGLKKELKSIQKYPKKKREEIVLRLEIRIKENKKLLQLILGNKLKEDCKKMWKYLDNRINGNQ